MKALVCALALLISGSAFADIDSGTSSFDFKMIASNGCVGLGDLAAASGFPNVNGGVVKDFRFHYSVDGDETTIDETSPYFTSTLEVDENGDMWVGPTEFCGLTPGHYTFKYELVDEMGSSLEFMKNEDFRAIDHAVDVQ
ncbi:MAG: hypothetical protein V4760_07545 [Bdellovibrionota bacterium]